MTKSKPRVNLRNQSRPITLCVALLLAPSCGSSTANNSAQAQPTPHVLHFRGELVADGLGLRTTQFHELSTNDGAQFTFRSSQMRTTATLSPVVLPARVLPPPSETITLKAPTSSEWSSQLDSILQSPREIKQWAQWLDAGLGPLAMAELRTRWQEMSANIHIDDKNAVVSATRGKSSVRLAGKLPLQVRPQSGDSLDGYVQFDIELHRAQPLASRGWLRLELRGEGSLQEAERFAMLVALCPGENTTASCHAASLPTLVPDRKRDTATSYVGAACAPRVAALKATIAASPHEAYVNTPAYPLVKSTHGSRSLYRRDRVMSLDVHRGTLVMAGRMTKRPPEKTAEWMRHKAGSRRLVVRLPAQQPVGTAIKHLTELAHHDDQIVLLAQEPHPRAASLVPEKASPWLKSSISRLLTLEDIEFIAGVGRLNHGTVICTSVIKLWGDVASMTANDRNTYFDAQLPQRILDCKCEGLDVDALDAFRRLMTVSHPKHAYRDIPLPITNRKSAPTIRFSKRVTGQQFVDRVSQLSPSQRRGFRPVFR